MSETNKTSIILKEHGNIMFARYLLTFLGFVVILAGSLTTLFLAQRKGSPDYFLISVYVIIALNALQICLCALAFGLRVLAGIYTRILNIFTYVVGAGWLISIAIAMALFYMDQGFLRTDLFIITVVQLLVAAIIYLIIPALERKSLNSLVRQDVRINADKRKRVSKVYIRAYAILTVCIILAQALALLAYKVPPKVYDIFSEARALEYELNEEGNAYIVTGVYNGTSTKVNIPAEYNNKPVIGIAAGAFTEDDPFTVNKIDSITFGTAEKAADGTEKIVSELRYIESGAIVNNQITELNLPESVESIGVGAVSGSALTTITYTSKAAFSANCFDAASIKTIILSGENVGRINSLEGLSTNVSIQVDKNIYNEYRKENPQHAKSFRPILGESEFCIDFYTDCDYYIESIIATNGTTVSLGYEDLVGENNTGKPISVDTLAYIKNNREVATEGAKDGYAFRGWYFDSDFVKECKFSETEKLTFTESTSLYAKWSKEYVADLDWDTYTPDNVEKRLYWAEGETIELPKGDYQRDGFDAGVVWFHGDETISNTSGISENLSLSAKWQLNIPEVGIEKTFSIQDYDEGDHMVRFTYDEEQVLTLNAVASHPISVNFLYRWERNGELEYESSFVNVQNVLEQGTYTLTVIAVATTGERSEAKEQLSVEIDKKRLDKGSSSISERYNLVYNGAKQSIEALNIPDDIVVNLVFRKDGEVISEGVITSDNTGVINAGVYELSAEYRKKSVAAVTNYETITETAEFVIAPKELTNFVWRGSWQTDAFGENIEVEYNGEQHSVYMTYDGILGDDQILPQYETIGGGASGYKNAGTYITTLKGINNPNYSILNCTNLSHEWNITPKKISVQSWVLDGNVDSSKEVIYDSSIHTVSAKVDGVVPADTGSIAFIYEGDGSAIEAGSYTASIIGVNNSNYQFDSEDVNRIFAWNIVKRALSASFSDEINLVYNGTEQTIKLNITGFAGNDYNEFDLSCFDGLKATPGANINFVKDVSGNCSIYFGIKNAGDYTLSVGANLTNVKEVLKNYTFDGASKEVTINKKLLSNPQVKTGYVYNGIEQTLELVYSGFYNDDAKNATFTGMNGEPSFDGKSFILTTNGTNAGKYELIVNDSAFNSDNYMISEYTATFTIDKRVLELKDYGYNGLSKATAVTYNGTAATCYAQFGNFASADIEEGVYKVEIADDSEIKNVGDYHVSITLASLGGELDAFINNYAFVEYEYAFTINPKSVIPYWSFAEMPDGGGDNEFVYSGNVIASPTASFGAQIFSGDNITVTYNDASGKTEYGTYTISITGLDNDNYAVEENNRDYTWKIVSKQLAFSWNISQTYVYNGDYQAPQLTVSGICGDDKVALNVLGEGIISCTISASNESGGQADPIKLFTDAGSYSLTVVSVGSNNYSLPHNNLTIGYEIQKAMLALSGWEWSNDLSYSEDVKKTGFDSLIYRSSPYILSNAISDSVGMSTDDVSLVYDGNIETNVGSYVARIIGLSGNDSDNFALPSEGIACAWSINPKKVRLNWTTTQFIFNGEYRNLVVSYDSGATSDADGRTYGDEALSFNYANNSARNADTYTAVAELNTQTGNYILDSDSASIEWTISPLALGEPTWSDIKFTYNGKEQYPEAKFNLLYSDDVAVSYTYPSEAVNAGEKTINVTGISGKDANNYMLSEEAKAKYKYTIVPAVAEIGWYYTKDGIKTAVTADSEYVYDGKSMTLTAEVSNKMRSDDAFSYTYDRENTAINAGDHVFTLTALGNANYTIEGASNTSLKFNIKKRTLNFTWENSGDRIYSASGYTLSAAAVNLALDDSISTITYNGTNTFTAVGEYTVSIVGITFVDSVDSSNYTWENVSATINITPRPVIIEWSDTEVIYDGVAHMPKVTVTGTDDVRIGSNEYNLSSSKEAIDVGDYEFELILKDNSNYTLTGASGNVSCTLKIVKCDVSAIWWDNSDNASFTGDLVDGSYTVEVRIPNLMPDAYSVWYRKEGGQEFAILEDNTLHEAGVYELKIELGDDYDKNYRLVNSLVTLDLGGPEDPVGE